MGVLLAALLDVLLFLGASYFAGKLLGVRVRNLLRPIIAPARRVLAARLVGVACVYLASALLSTAVLRATGTYGTVVEVAPNMPAAQAGVLSGDRIVSMDGVRVTRFVELADHLRDADHTRPTLLELDRAGEVRTISVLPTPKGLIGVRPSETIDYPLVDALLTGLASPPRLIHAALTQVLEPQVEPVTGPVAIVEGSSWSGFTTWLSALAGHIALGFPFLVGYLLLLQLIERVLGGRIVER